ncbi:flagellar export protein FliJ [Coralliovum pocilloporae]|uniref:flagellar export protein FliJ n=1 Tax=Coralliovum pocilloporae TaxID=3066369 RepID=UPI0033078536
MKSRETLIRLKRFQVDEKRRQVSQIEVMMDDFQRMARELDQQIVDEQEKAGIHDVAHFAYPTFAKAAMQRRDNLQVSIDDLKAQLDHAQEELQAAVEELKKFELLEARDQEQARLEQERVEQASVDEVAARRARSR